jgi:hypothetical protein
MQLVEFTTLGGQKWRKRRVALSRGQMFLSNKCEGLVSKCLTPQMCLKAFATSIGRNLISS